MSLYCFQTYLNSDVERWVKETKERGKESNLLKNPFHWKIKTIKRHDRLFVIVDAKPVYFNFSWFGWITGGGILVIWGPTAWIIPFLLIGCCGIFWTAEPLFLLTKKALRKYGYKEYIKRLKFSEIIREVMM